MKYSLRFWIIDSHNDGKNRRMAIARPERLCGSTSCRNRQKSSVEVHDLFKEQGASNSAIMK